MKKKLTQMQRDVLSAAVAAGDSGLRSSDRIDLADYGGYGPSQSVVPVSAATSLVKRNMLRAERDEHGFRIWFVTSDGASAHVTGRAP